MNSRFSYRKIPRSRIATFDTFSVGLKRHHVIALLEFDVTDARKKLRELRKQGIKVSFNAWLIKTISSVLHIHPEAAGYLRGKKKMVIFDDINVSVIIEKVIGENRVPVPLVIEKANEKSAEEIASEIESARKQDLSGNDIVLKLRTTFYENLYYRMSGFMRRFIWKVMLNNPGLAFSKMGNVVVTSVGMMGKINGWFIHKSVHPVSFGVGSVLKKPVVIENEVKVREILNMTILVDHDVIEGAQMVRFLNDLTDYIENVKDESWQIVHKT